MIQIQGREAGLARRNQFVPFFLAALVLGGFATEASARLSSAPIMRIGDQTITEADIALETHPLWRPIPPAKAIAGRREKFTEIVKDLLLRRYFIDRKIPEPRRKLEDHLADLRRQKREERLIIEGMKRVYHEGAAPEDVWRTFPDGVVDRRQWVSDLGRFEEMGADTYFEWRPSGSYYDMILRHHDIKNLRMPYPFPRQAYISMFGGYSWRAFKASFYWDHIYLLFREEYGGGRDEYRLYARELQSEGRLEFFGADWERYFWEEAFEPVSRYLPEYDLSFIRVGDESITDDIDGSRFKDVAQSYILRHYWKARSIEIPRELVERAVNDLQEMIVSRRLELKGLRRVHENNEDPEEVWRSLFETSVRRPNVLASWLRSNKGREEMYFRELEWEIRDNERRAANTESYARTGAVIESWKTVQDLGLVHLIEEKLVEEFGYDHLGVLGAIGRYVEEARSRGTLGQFSDGYEPIFWKLFPPRPLPGETEAAVTAESWNRGASSGRPGEGASPGRTTPETFAHSFHAAVLFDTAYLPALIAEIRKARQEILISMLVASRGEGAEPILTALHEASRRGVTIQAVFRTNHQFAEVMPGESASGIDPSLSERTILIDGTTMILGSPIWIDTSLGNQPNIALILTGPGEAFMPWRDRFDLRRRTATPVTRETYVAKAMPGIPEPSEQRVPTKGRIILDEAYPNAVHQLIDFSDSEVIGGFQYIARYTLEQGPFHILPILMAAKAERGVDLLLIIDEMRWSPGTETSQRQVIRWFNSRGIRARSPNPEGAALHIRTIVGDERYVILGSHLWWRPTRVETSVFLDSTELGARIANHLRAH